jgi:hypothetical protein
MKYLILSSLLLVTIVAAGQDTTKFDHLSDFTALVSRIDSLEARIKVLESRPYFMIIPMSGKHNRGIWMTDPVGRFSLLIKSFDYTLYTDSVLQARSYNQVTY